MKQRPPECVYGELLNWAKSSAFSGFDTLPGCAMPSSLLLHLIVTFIRLARPGGLRSIVAESVLVKHQPLILSRAPNLSAAERIVAGLCVLFMNSAPVLRCAMVLKPSPLPWSK